MASARRDACGWDSGTAKEIRAVTQRFFRYRHRSTVKHHKALSNRATHRYSMHDQLQARLLSAFGCCPDVGRELVGGEEAPGLRGDRVCEHRQHEHQSERMW